MNLIKNFIGVMIYAKKRAIAPLSGSQLAYKFTNHIHLIENAFIIWRWPPLSSSSSLVNARHQTFMMSSALFACPL